MPGQLVIFPDQFLPIQEWNPEKLRKYPCLIGGFSQDFSQEEFQEAISQIMQKRFRSRRSKYPSPRGECDFKIIQVTFPEGQYSLVLEDFLVFNPPIQSRSQKQGSKALYYAANREEGLLLQYLPPYSQTSSHDHEIYKWIEYYYLLAGEAILRISEGQYLLTGTTPVAPVVKPDVVHQVMTEDLPSLIIIEIKGDPNWFERWLTGEGHTFKNFL